VVRSARSEIEVPRRPCGTSSCCQILPRTAPDFLHAALDRSAYAAFFTESRTRLLDSTKLHRKSGSVLGYFQPELSKLAGWSTLFR
jgi:hypothetical protein